MEEKDKNFNGEKLFFSYQEGEKKYYFLTGSSGYPLADYDFPGLPACKANGIVVVEVRPKTAGVLPGFDAGTASSSGLVG